jgi:pimeloyl-ACP methyl ester carboxylesterase
VGDSFIDGTRVYEYRLEARADKELIPFAVLVPASAQAEIRKDVVMLLHGHGETAAAPFDEDSEMRNIGGRLLEEGYVVVSVEMRSFGEYKIDGKGHDQYIADLDDGEFVGRVLLDNLDVARALEGLFPPEEFGTLTVFGHSFGGYIALHVGALIDRVTQTMSSGHFAPYGCINTDFHDACQDILAIDGLFEIYDTAGMIAPRGRVDLFFGGQDTLYTGAVDQAFERLEVIFDKLGAPGQATMTVNPSLGHEVDVEAVLSTLPPLP